MGCPHDMKIRAGPNPPAQRRSGPAPLARVPSLLKIIVILIVILPLGRHAMVSRLLHLHPGAMPSASSNHLPAGWTESRCDTVCLRSRLFEAWHRPGLTNDFPPGATLATTPRARTQKSSKNPVISLLSP